MDSPSNCLRLWNLNRSAIDNALVINDFPAIWLSPDKIFLQVLSDLLKYEGGCKFFHQLNLIMMQLSKNHSLCLLWNIVLVFQHTKTMRFNSLTKRFNFSNISCHDKLFQTLKLDTTESSQNIKNIRRIYRINSSFFLNSEKYLRRQFYVLWVQ